MTDKYKWIGRKVRHAHAPVGKRPEFLGLVFDTDGKPTVRGDVCDWFPCNCGYLNCSKTGPCAPKPKDELPEGWKLHFCTSQYNETYDHTSGARVWRVMRAAGWSAWGFSPDIHNEVSALSDAAKPTRELAMAAALASVEPKACAECGNQYPPFIGPTGDGSYHCRHGAVCSARQLRQAREQSKPAEPELRPGWTRVHADLGPGEVYVRTGVGHVFKTGRGDWKVAGDCFLFCTLNGAMERAEEMAGAR